MMLFLFNVQLRNKYDDDDDDIQQFTTYITLQEKFPQNKAVSRFRKRLREYVKSSGRHFEHLLYGNSKSVHTYGVRACLERY